MFARGTATEVLVHEEDFGVCEARFVKGMDLTLGLELLSVIFEGVFSKAFKDDGAQVACRDDSIRIDVVAAQNDARTGNTDAF
jgi:hypothetical protein